MPQIRRGSENPTGRGTPFRGGGADDFGALVFGADTHMLEAVAPVLGAGAQMLGAGAHMLEAVALVLGAVALVLGAVAHMLGDSALMLDVGANEREVYIQTLKSSLNVQNSVLLGRVAFRTNAERLDASRAGGEGIGAQVTIIAGGMRRLAGSES